MISLFRASHWKRSRWRSKCMEVPARSAMAKKDPDRRMRRRNRNPHLKRSASEQFYPEGCFVSRKRLVSVILQGSPGDAKENKPPGDAAPTQRPSTIDVESARPSSASTLYPWRTTGRIPMSDSGSDTVSDHDFVNGLVGMTLNYAFRPNLMCPLRRTRKPALNTRRRRRW